MDEAHWLSSDDPFIMLGCLRGLRKGAADRRDARRLRLFACACCRRVLTMVSPDVFIDAVQTAEAYADGKGSPEQLDVYQGQARGASERHLVLSAWPMSGPTWAGYACCHVASRATTWPLPAGSRWSPWALAEETARAAAFAAAGGVYQLGESRWLPAQPDAHLAEETAQAALLRDLFGNPFRPGWQPGPLADPKGAPGQLARVIYAERRFEEMPVLGDALEDAGCSDPDVVAHCRCGQPHARGCWVVDGLRKW